MENTPHRRPRRSNPQESSRFSSSSGDRQHNPVKSAIDDSLAGVRFNQHDMHTVLRSSRQAARLKKRRSVLSGAAFAACVAALLIPVILFSLSTRSIRDANVLPLADRTTAAPAATAQPGEDIVSPQATPAPTAPPTLPPSGVSHAISESRAVEIARACFESQCDTTIFAFDEYAVDVRLTQGEGAQYVVTMDCMYGNGCRFTVALSADTGEILQYSSPQMATVPAATDRNSAQVSAWYEEHGPYLFTWPQDVQAEFSRRYQGATIRIPREGEMSGAQAIIAAQNAAEDRFTCFYPVLFDERTGGAAVYTVYCYEEAVTDVLPDGASMTVTLDAQTGEILSVE